MPKIVDGAMSGNEKLEIDLGDLVETSKEEDEAEAATDIKAHIVKLEKRIENV